jgi:hypothetical protein
MAGNFKSLNAQAERVEKGDSSEHDLEMPKFS